MEKIVEKLYNKIADFIIGEDEVKGEYVNIRCNHSKEQSEVELEDILSYIENHYEGDHEHE